MDKNLESNNPVMIYSQHKKYHLTTLVLILLSFTGSLFPQEAKPVATVNTGTDVAPKSSFLDGLTLEGLVRFRYENRHNPVFNKTTINNNTNFVGAKAQLGFTKVFSEYVTAKVLLQETGIWGGEYGAESGNNTGIAGSQVTTTSSTGAKTTTTIPGNAASVRESWIEVKNSKGFGVQAGRQILNYGDQRLVGGQEWANTGRSFDGIKVKYDNKFFSSHAWGMVLGAKDSDAGTNFSTPNVSNSKLKDAYFTGWYNTAKVNKHLQIEAYYMGIYKRFLPKNDPNVIDPVTGQPYAPITLATGAAITSQDYAQQRDNLNTFGSRWTNKTEKNKSVTPFDITGEYVIQRGNTGKYVNNTNLPESTIKLDPTLFDKSHNPCKAGYANGGCNAYTSKQKYNAYAVALNAGYTIKKRVRIGGEYNRGSGDSYGNNGGTRGAYTNLFGTNHAHYGQQDIVSWSNMTARSGDITFFTEKLGNLKLSYWLFQKTNVNDAWYNVGGNANSGQSTQSYYALNGMSTVNLQTGINNYVSRAFLKKDLGQEFDLLYDLNSLGINWQFGYSRFIAGKAITNAMDGFAYNTYLYFADQAAGVKGGPTAPGVTKYKANPTSQWAYFMATYKF